MSFNTFKGKKSKQNQFYKFFLHTSFLKRKRRLREKKRATWVTTTTTTIFFNHGDSTHIILLFQHNHHLLFLKHSMNSHHHSSLSYAHIFRGSRTLIWRAAICIIEAKNLFLRNADLSLNIFKSNLRFFLHFFFLNCRDFTAKNISFLLSGLIFQLSAEC